MNVSVIIPAYNAERWIGRAIDSVLRQTVMPAEVIVVDDGSTDGTAQAARRYGTAIRYFYQENSGPSMARNRGIAEAKSEWLAFLDADDEWLPHKMESQLRVLRENSHLPWCSCAYSVAASPISRPGTLPEGPRQERRDHTPVRYFFVILEGMRFQTSSYIIRKSVFDELGTFDPNLRSGEDIDMWCRIALRYPWIGYCFDPCYCYHKDNPESAYRKGRVNRDLPVKSFCKNMRLAMELGREPANDFRPYARKRVMDSLLRVAAGDCIIKAETIDDVMRLFPFATYERALLKVLSWLPKTVALRIVDQLRGRISL